MSVDIDLMVCCIEWLMGGTPAMVTGSLSHGSQPLVNTTPPSLSAGLCCGAFCRVTQVPIALGCWGQAFVVIFFLFFLLLPHSIVFFCQPSIPSNIILAGLTPHNSIVGGLLKPVHRARQEIQPEQVASQQLFSHLHLRISPPVDLNVHVEMWVEGWGSRENPYKYLNM